MKADSQKMVRQYGSEDRTYQYVPVNALGHQADITSVSCVASHAGCTKCTTTDSFARTSSPSSSTSWRRYWATVLATAVHHVWLMARCCAHVVLRWRLADSGVCVCDAVAIVCAVVSNESVMPARAR